MESIRIKEREIPLIYTVLEMKEMQEEIGPLSDLNYIVCGRNKEDPTDQSRYGTPEHLTAIAKMVRILGNAGLEEAGEEPDLTEKMIMRGLKPWELVDAVSTCMRAMTDGMKSEIPVPKKKGRVDVTLEEMNRKKKRGS